jgi:quercetin dioxygenase-like cupin family protein
MNPTIRKPGEGRTITLVGDVHRFVTSGEDTNGKYAQFEAIVPPGGGPPAHFHTREEEGFYIIEGEIAFQIGDQRLIARAGMFANMPVGTPHSFKNESDRPARMLVTMAPAGLLRDSSRLARRSPMALPPACLRRKSKSKD